MEQRGATRGPRVWRFCLKDVWYGGVGQVFKPQAEGPRGLKSQIFGRQQSLEAGSGFVTFGYHVFLPYASGQGVGERDPSARC